MSIYDFKVKTIEGEEIPLEKYKGKVLLIVNTASKCGFTPQYKDLEELYKKFNSKGFEILGFPCNQFAEQEPGSNSEVKKFCELNYGVTFPLFAKIDVRGDSADPLFKHLSESLPFKGFNLNHPNGNTLNNFLKENFPKYLEGNSIKWNFTKFLIDKYGNVVGRFEPTTEPSEIIPEIEKLL
ncbi:glutathione peroxidase [Clostridium novyi A str. 4570]|uniref:Glutathione peroxidase n=1 Tax=Clostridium novyi A str. 4570 TaxID=1444290 RepID=A0AA89CRC6_CLONO|nr:glutathione peroxidase [Clostridium novyi]KGN01731.1 glutathione peroxidase [Clostridium novyi A str. 4570]